MHIAHTTTIPCATEVRLTHTRAAQIAGTIAVLALIACMLGTAAHTSAANAQEQAAAWRSLHYAS